MTLFSRPRHPYTEGLLRAMPQAGDPRPTSIVIDGIVPTGAQMPTGCRFHPRCPYATNACREHAATVATARRRWDVAASRIDELLLEGADVIPAGRHGSARDVRPSRSTSRSSAGSAGRWSVRYARSTA